MIIFFAAIVIILLILSQLIDYAKVKLMFHPSKIHQSAGSFPIPPLDIRINNDNETIHGWFFQQSTKYPTILISHGNAGNISDRRELINTLLQLKCNVFIYDYQGYGESTGSPSELNCYADGESAYNYLTETLYLPDDQIILLGESIGCGVASYLAQKKHNRKLILLSGFSSIKDMFESLLPIQLTFFKFLGIFLKEFPVNKYLSSYKGQTLILHSQVDEIVPYDHALTNSRVNPKSCKLINISGPHNAPFFSDFCLNEINSFINGGNPP